MKRSILLSFGMGMLAIGVYGQDQDTTMSVNALTAPSSPAFVIMGIEPSNIEKPTDPSDFVISIRNATDNFSMLPKNFALEFAPGWVFAGRSIRYEDFEANKAGQSIKQGTTISFGINTIDQGDSASLTQSALGFKMPVFRGTLDQEYKDYHKKLTEAMSRVRRVNELIGAEIVRRVSVDPALLLLNQQLADPGLSEDRRRELLSRMDQRSKEVMKEAAASVGMANEKTIDSLRTIAKNMEVRRWGFKLDLAGAMELDFEDQKFDHSSISRYGVWVTGGYEFRKAKIGILGVARMISNPDQQYEKNDTTTVTGDNLEGDLGARLIIENLRHFTFSGEVVYRASFNIQEIDPTWRYILNIDYQFAPNKLISFSFGKNFDGTTTTGGNLVAALNLVLGFGSKR